MKKKITSLFAMALMFAGVANAQVEELQGYKTVSVSDEVLTMDQIVPETQWYAVYQQRGGGGYWWAATPEHNASKNYAENTVCMSIGTEVLDNMPIASTVAAYIVRFLPTDTEGTFNVQFGNGTYMMSAAHNTVVKYTTDIAEAAQVRMYNIVTTGEDGSEVVNEGHWGFNFADNDVRIDNNAQGNSVAGWDSGTITTTGGNNDHQIYAIAIGETTEFEALKNEAIAVFNEYMQHYGTFVDVEPGVPGHYSAEAVAAFEAALEEGAALEDADETWTAEMFQAIVDKIESTYQAVLDSRIPFATEVAEGYYLIQTAPFFYYTTGGTEETVDPETGETIPGNPGEEVHLSKGLRGAVSNGAVFAAWDTYDAAADDRAVFLWKVTSKGDKKYELKNMGYEVNAAYWSSSNNLVLNEGDSTVVFDYNAYVEVDSTGVETRYYNIRPSQNAERDYFYIHCNNHGGGAGTADWIVKWTAGDGINAGASEWKLIPVSEADAQAMIDAFAPVKDAEGRLNKAQEILADVETKLIVAKDESVNIFNEEGKELITDVAQFYSPYTQTDEGSYEGLLDGVLSGEGAGNWYWHSSWSGGAVAGGLHYLQVALPDDAPEVIAFQFTRRNVQNDHTTKWTVYGTNTNDQESEEKIAKEACTLLATVITPFTNNTETLTSTAFNTQGCKYIRFYSEVQAPTVRGYWHVSEFQVYPAEVIVNETSQAVSMGEVFTNMQAAVEKAKPEIDSLAVTVETLNELKAAYDAFIAMYVNPDTLRQKITAIDGVEKYIVVGDAPGYWKDETTGKGVTDAVAAAKAYDAAGKYTLAESQAQIAALDAAKAAMLDAANKVQEGKWYQFQFASEDLYTEQGWDKAGADANVNEETEIQVYPALYDRFVCVGEVVNDGTEDEPQYETYPAEETPAGTGLHYMDELQLDEDMSLFRFIAIGDSAYVIQNKATGLFLYTAGGAVTLQPAATTWKATAMGFGKVMVTGHNPEGAGVNHLHAQRNGNTLVTWGADGIESNTGFMVIENSDVDASYDGTEFQMAIAPNSMSSYCFPTDITAVDGELLGVEINEGEITLTKMADKTAKAGEPFIYINGDYSAYDAEAEVEAELVNFKHGYDVVAEPKTVGKHIGTFYGLSGDDAPAKGNVLVKANGLEIAKASSNVNAFSSYIKAELEADAVLNVTVKEDGTFDSIQEVVNQAVKGGNIYTIDGKFVGKGNLNTKLSRGTYIINGVKVIVK